MDSYTLLHLVYFFCLFFANSDRLHQAIFDIHMRGYFTIGALTALSINHFFEEMIEELYLLEPY